MSPQWTHIPQPIRATDTKHLWYSNVKGGQATTIHNDRSVPYTLEPPTPIDNDRPGPYTLEPPIPIDNDRLAPYIVEPALEFVVVRSGI